MRHPGADHGITPPSFAHACALRASGHLAFSPSPYFDGSITQTANGLSASLASSLHAGGQPKDFRPKPREGILKSANPKEPKDTKRRYFGRTRLILSEKGVILAEIEHFRQKFPTTEMHIFAETFRYFYQNQKTFGQKPKERPFV